MESDLDVTRRGAWTVVTVYGELDLARGPAFRQRVLGCLGDGDERLVVDLGPTDFVDSVGLGMLVAVLKRVRATDRELIVVCPEPRIRKLFDLTGLDDVFRFADTVDDVVGS